MTHHPAVPLVFDDRFFEALAERMPGRQGIQRETEIGLGDRHDECTAEAFAESCGYDEPALIIKSVLGPTGETRHVADGSKPSTLSQFLPFPTTIPGMSSTRNGRFVNSIVPMALQRRRPASDEGWSPT